MNGEILNKLEEMRPVSFDPLNSNPNKYINGKDNKNMIIENSR
jgi:hypothetical protein